MRKQKKLLRLLQDLEEKKKKILSVDIAWQGSLNKRWMTCGNPNCACKKDPRKKHGPYWWWTKKVSGKTKAILIPNKFVPQAQQYVKNYKTLKNIFQSILQLSEEIIQIKLEKVKSDNSNKS